MQKVTFSKYSGAGNDFVLIDEKLNPGFEIKPENIIKLCDRRNGIGADGVLLISDSDKYSFNMEYFNADSTGGMLCGNGARCALSYANHSGRIVGKNAEFLSNGVEYSGEIISDKKVKFNLNNPTEIKLNFELKADDKLITASFINTGSPHAVVNIDDNNSDNDNLKNRFGSIENLPVFSLGKEIRYLPEFEPIGTNVNFIKIEKDRIFIRTYERGVENETLACGTGIVASALISYLNNKIGPPVSVTAVSGETLVVDFKVVNQIITEVSLTGSAEETFKGEIFI